MAIGVKTHTVRRSGDNDIEITLWEREPDESGPRHTVSIDGCGWSDNGLSPKAARKVAAVLLSMADRAEPNKKSEPDAKDAEILSLRTDLTAATERAERAEADLTAACALLREVGALLDSPRMLPDGHDSLTWALLFKLRARIEALLGGEG